MVSSSSASYSLPGLEFLTDHVGQHFHLTPSDYQVQVITQGASGRTIVRLTWKDSSLIGVKWTNNRADNHSFVPVGQFLFSAGIKVPKILDFHLTTEGEGWAIIQDLGDANLLSYSDQPWEHRRPLYDSALREVHRLHTLVPPAELALQPAFDSSLYSWEQAYFAEHVIGTICNQDPTTLTNHPLFRALAHDLASLPRCLLHRDFQSQNIHIVGQQAYLIDFQGMRLGLAEYDLASLIYDPYTGLGEAERLDLISDWEEICGQPLDRHLFRQCALQRLLQATGAYANYGTKGNKWYASFIQPTLKAISGLVGGTEYEPVLAPIIASAQSHLPPC